MGTAIDSIWRATIATSSWVRIDEFPEKTWVRITDSTGHRITHLVEHKAVGWNREQHPASGCYEDSPKTPCMSDELYGRQLEGPLQGTSDCFFGTQSCTGDCLSVVEVRLDMLNVQLELFEPVAAQIENRNFECAHLEACLPRALWGRIEKSVALALFE